MSEKGTRLGAKELLEGTLRRVVASPLGDPGWEQNEGGPGLGGIVGRSVGEQGSVIDSENHQCGELIEYPEAI